MQTNSQKPNYGGAIPSIPQATGMAMPDPIKESAPADKVSIETPKQGPSTLDKYNAVASAVSNSVQKGLSYANARRAREKYNANDNL